MQFCCFSGLRHSLTKNRPSISVERQVNCRAKGKCGVKKCGVKMWHQTQMWKCRIKMRRQGKCGVKQCGDRHKCGGKVASTNVASAANVAAVRNVASENVASKCGRRRRLSQTVFQERRPQNRLLRWQAQNCYAKCPRALLKFSWTIDGRNPAPVK